jgi:hypothetical protein
MGILRSRGIGVMKNRIEVPPKEWERYAEHELEFTFEFDPTGHDVIFVRNDPFVFDGADKLQMLLDMPKIIAAVEQYRKSATPRCCAWGGCGSPGSICPFFRFRAAREGERYWLDRAPYIKVTAWKKR